MKICVVGTGYVGLVAGTCLAESGNDVIAVDKDQDKIDALKRGEIPIYEPGLAELVERNSAEERLSFSTDIGEAVQRSLIIFVAVGTPSDASGAADLSSVWSVAETVAKAMNGYKIVVLKSTVPVGTASRVQEILAANTVHEFDVVSNPEFLKEGAAVVDFLKPDRVVIGTGNVRVAEIMKELYAPFVRTGRPILVMDNKSAEMTKYAANALLATRISFMNEVANLCERVGADVNLVREGIASDSRIGYQFLFPGVGFGGSCFPKDIRALVDTGREHGLDLRVVKAADEANEEQKTVLVRKVVGRFGEDLAGRKFAVWGLAFKPKTDDMREAPSVVVIDGLLSRGASVSTYDPEAMNEARKVFGDRVEYATSNYKALADADALVLVTEWNEFRRPDFDKVKALLKQPVVFDGRNVYDGKAMRERGFEYFGIGA